MKNNELDQLDFTGIDEIDKLDFTGIEKSIPTKTVSQALTQKAQNIGEDISNIGKSALQTGIESAADIGRGVSQGLTFGFADEAIAGIKAARDIALTDKESKDFKDLYRQYQVKEQEKLKEAEERSPYLTTAGEIVGGILPAIATAGLAAPSIAKTGVKLLSKEGLKKTGKAGAIAVSGGAVYGAGKSEEGKLIGASEEEKEKLKADIVGGALTSGIIGGTLSVAAQLAPPLFKAGKEKIGKKIDEFIEDSPFFRQLRKAKELGEEGINISSDKAKFGVGDKPGLLSRDTENSRDLLNRIYTVDDKLGQNVGKVIDDASESGVIIDVNDEMKEAAKTFVDLFHQDKTIAANPRAKKLYDTMFKINQLKEVVPGEQITLTPREVQSLRNQVVDFSDSIKVKDPYLASLGYDFQNKIGNVLKSRIPEYKIAAERFESFRRLIPETIISGSTPIELSSIKLSKLKNQEGKLFDSIRKMIQGATKPGVASKEEAETFVNFVRGLKQFEVEDANRVKQGLVKELDLPKLVDNPSSSQAKSMEKLIRDKADESAMLQQVWGVNPQEGPTSVIKGALAGISSTGRGVSMNLANKYGLHKDTLTKPIKAPVQLAKNIHKASSEELRAVGERMSEVPGLSSLGKALINGLENKDQSKINAAIFAIMQNPQARILINAEKLESEEQ